MTVESGELMDIGTVAAHNIAQACGLGEDKVLEVRNHIRDEISAMGSHFSLAVADVQTQYEVALKDLTAKHAADLAAVKADYSFVNEHKVAVLLVVAVVFGLGVATGLIV